jgi:hypothetical protein
MMAIPTQITFRGLAHSDPLEGEIRERSAWLGQFYADILGCRVLVEVPHRHRHSGRHFHVRIEVTVPGGGPVVVSHEPSPHGPLKDTERAEHHKESEIESVHRYASVAVHDAFDAARRLLQDFARKQRGDVKIHEVTARGEVIEVSQADPSASPPEGDAQ